MKARFQYTGIRVKDLDASIKFYTSVLGMKAGSRDTFDATKGVAIFMVDEAGNHPLELNFYEAGSKFDSKFDVGEGLDHLSFKVADLDSAVDEAEKAGYPVVQEIKTSTSRWVYIQDPNGIWIELAAESAP